MRSLLKPVLMLLMLWLFAVSAFGRVLNLSDLRIINNAAPTIVAGSVSGSASSCIGSASVNYLQFTLSAHDLTNSVSVIPSSNFEVSLTNSNYGVSLGMPVDYIEPRLVTIYVRLSPTAPAGTQTGDIVIKSVGAADVHVAVTGIVTDHLYYPDLEVVPVSAFPVCAGIDQTFKAQAPDPGIDPHYTWQINGTDYGTDSPVFTTNILKEDDVLSCILTNPNTCNTGTVFDLVIKTQVPPTVSFNRDLTIKKGESVSLSPNLSGNIASYKWSPSAGLNNDAIQNPSASPNSTTVYTLTIKGTGGCEVGATVKVNVIEPAGTTAKPDITYTTPNTYVKNIAIPPLSPINTGGAVPATIYGETKVVAGTGQFGSVNGDASTAQFKLPYGISIDADGDMYIAESGGGIRMVSVSGQVSSIGADALPGPPFNVPKLNNPRGVVKDRAGNLFVANYSNHNILKITPAGVITVFAGINQSGTADGPGNVANIINPSGIAIDKNDNLYVTDGNNAIRQISPAGYVYTIAGQPAAGTLDGQGRAAKFNKPAGIAVDNDGNIYVADQAGFVIRKITPSGFVTTIAGKGTYSSNDGMGTAAGFQSPKGITVDASGNLYVTESGLGTIRRISPDGEVKTIAGGGPNGVNSGVGTDVHFSSPEGITIGPDGNLYVAEYGGNSIKQVIATGYTIDKALPAGLTFDPRTGIVTGTPTVLWPRTDYTITAYNAGGSDKFILSIEVNDVAPPEIGVGDVSGIVTACVGSVSVGYQQFTVSEINLTDDVIVTAPANFEVSLSPNGGYGNSLVIPLADLQLPPDGDGITVYVRLGATAPVGNPTGNVVLKSTVATDALVPVSGVVKAKITPSVTAEQVGDACPGPTVSFKANPVNEGINPIYRWFVNNIDQNKTGPTFTAPATITADDKVTVQLTNTSDCTDHATVSSLPVSPVYSPKTPIAVTISAPSVYPVCEGTDQVFTALPGAGGNLTYQWQLNQVNVGANSNQYQSSTLKNGDVLTCTVSGTDQCTVPGVSGDFVVETFALPTVAFSGELSIKKGGSVTLVPTLSDDIATYSWSPSVGLNSSDIKNPIASPTETTTYTLTVTSLGGCPAPASVKVNVLEQMVVPNAFTPNGDGTNDTWSIPGLAAYPNCRVNVYNRYGAGIFSSIGYAKNWNGSFNGYVLPAGTYYYTIDLKDGNKPLSGYVVLLK